MRLLKRVPWKVIYVGLTLAAIAAAAAAPGNYGGG